MLIEKRNYLHRFYLSMVVLFVLTTWPHPMWIVRFISLFLFAILAAWTERAAMEMKIQKMFSEIKT
jgi:hypothetical protein